MTVNHGFVVGLGLVLGSFLSVCIHRIPRSLSVVKPRSHCPHCGHYIRLWENIPLLSYLFLGGKCSMCREQIGWVYPVVEVLTAVLCFALFSKYGLSLIFLVNTVFFSLLLALIFVDLYARILPNSLTLGGMVFGFLTSPLQSKEFFLADASLSGLSSLMAQYLQSLLGAFVGSGLLWLVAKLYLKIRRREGMGFGDIKMMAMVGVFLGWHYALLTIFLGSFLGALVGSAFILVFRKGIRYELPFGTFLGIGAIVSTLWGEDLLTWYLAVGTDIPFTDC